MKKPDNDQTGPTRLTDPVVLILFSIAYFYDFIVGIVSIIMMYKIANFNDASKNQNLNEENQLLFVIYF